MPIIIEIHGLNNTTFQNTNQNKTKRTLNHQIYNYGENKPVVVYVDNVPASSNNPNGDISNYNSNSRSISFGNSPVRSYFEVPKVAAQQVLYEFQQTPTNAVSNVHVKQLFHSPGGDSSDTTNYEQNSQPENHQNQYSASETVVTPIQHSAYTNHGQNYAHVNYHPLYNIQPHHVQSQHFVPGKYFYVNGRIVYQPTPALQQNQQKLPLKYGNTYQPQQKLMPPPVQRPASYSRFVPPQRHEMQSITSPITPAPPTKAPAPVQAVEEDDEEENASLQENEDDVEEAEEDDERPKYQQEDDEAEEDGERNPVFGRYKFDEDEDLEERERYREDDEAEEEDDDSRGGSSKYVSKKTRKSPKKKNGKSGKYNNKDNYSYSEGYSTSSKYEYPSKKKKNGKKGVKSQKSVRYAKGTKPQIEGRYSENIPITHKHKIFKEKWYVTKKTDDNLERSSEEF